MLVKQFKRLYRVICAIKVILFWRLVLKIEKTIFRTFLRTKWSLHGHHGRLIERDQFTSMYVPQDLFYKKLVPDFSVNESFYSKLC